MKYSWQRGLNSSDHKQKTDTQCFLQGGTKGSPRWAATAGREPPWISVAQGCLWGIGCRLWPKAGTSPMDGDVSIKHLKFLSLQARRGQVEAAARLTPKPPKGAIERANPTKVSLTKPEAESLFAHPSHCHSQEGSLYPNPIQTYTTSRLCWTPLPPQLLPLTGSAR